MVYEYPILKRQIADSEVERDYIKENEVFRGVKALPGFPHKP